MSSVQPFSSFSFPCYQLSMADSSPSSIALQALPGAATTTICSNLDWKLYRMPLPPATRRAIFNQMWNLKPESHFPEGEHSAYFRYYEAQCNGLTRPMGRALLREQNQEYLLNIIGHLQNSDTEYQSLVDLLLREYPQLDRSLVCPSVFIAARLWSMLNIGVEEQALTPGQNPVDWKEGKLKQCVQQCFECDSEVPNVVKLSKNFNAMSLEQIGNIQIVWTSNLADHLSMRDDDTKVIIFHHASFLRQHKDGNL